MTLDCLLENCLSVRKGEASQQPTEFPSNLHLLDTGSLFVYHPPSSGPCFAPPNIVIIPQSCCWDFLLFSCLRSARSYIWNASSFSPQQNLAQAFRRKSIFANGGKMFHISISGGSSLSSIVNISEFALVTRTLLGSGC